MAKDDRHQEGTAVTGKYNYTEAVQEVLRTARSSRSPDVEGGCKITSECGGYKTVIHVKPDGKVSWAVLDQEHVLASNGDK